MRARNLGARIRSARNAIGMSQEALGQAMGFATRQPISRIERGVRTVQPDELQTEYRTAGPKVRGFSHSPLLYS